MRRVGRASSPFARFAFAVVWICALVLAGLPAVASGEDIRETEGAQQGTINPRLPPPPPPPEEPARAPEAPPKLPEPAAPPADLPAKVAIPAGTRLAVVLDTPLSTRIARQGQLVSFRTSDALRVAEQLELPPETGFTGSVVEVKRPGRFGKPGVLRVKVDRLNLSTGATQEIVARLDSPDLTGRGRLSSDSNRTTDLYNLALYTLEGTLLGSQINGGKGAAIGAGAGALAAVLIMMSRRGADIYLEPGMPFLVILDRPVELSGLDVFTAQQNYSRAQGSINGSDGNAGVNSGSSEIQRDPEGAVLDSDRPKLKRRPKNP